jgi:hypothetical protein
MEDHGGIDSSLYARTCNSDRDLLVMSLRDRERKEEIEVKLFNGKNHLPVSNQIVLCFTRLNILPILTQECTSFPRCRQFDSLSDTQDVMHMGQDAVAHTNSTRPIPVPQR